MVFRLKVKTKETQISPSRTVKHQSPKNRVAHSWVPDTQDTEVSNVRIDWFNYTKPGRYFP